MLKKTLLTLILACTSFWTANSQTAHKPAAMMKIMKDSRITYTVGPLYIDVPDQEYDALNETGMYREDNDGVFVIKKITLAKEADSEWNAAEKAFNQDANYKEARKHYKNVVDIQPEYYLAKVQMGKCFEKEGDLEKAEAAYRQAISKNYIDYMPHWLLAQTYMKEKKLDDAVSEITVANILNRNDTAIQGDMAGIYTMAKLRYEDWTFTPQYKVFKGQKDSEIKVLVQDGWLGYAVGKALWTYEPGYAEGLGEKPGSPSLMQERECLNCLLAGTDTSQNKEEDKSMIALERAQEYKLIDGFAYYEELLPQRPSLVYKLPNNVIKAMKNYVVMAHGGGRPQ